MKKLLLVFVVALSLSSFAPANKADFNFVGKWIGKTDKGEMSGFIFDKDGYVSLIKGGKVTGGRESVINGKKTSLKYDINQATDPMELEMTSESIENGKPENMQFHFIIKIIDSNHIIVGSAKKPYSFTDKNSFTLARE